MENEKKITFSKLWVLLESNGLNKRHLINNGIYPTTVARLTKNENVTTDVIAKICSTLNCQPKDIMSYGEENENNSLNNNNFNFNPVTDCNYGSNCDTCDLGDICRARMEVCDYYDNCKSCNHRLYCRGNHMKRKPGAKPMKQSGNMIILDEDILKFFINNKNK